MIRNYQKKKKKESYLTNYKEKKNRDIGKLIDQEKRLNRIMKTSIK